MTTEDGVEAKGTAPADDGPAPKAKKAAAAKGGKGLALLIIAAVVVVGLGVGAALLYVFSSVGKTRSVAHEHLPPTCDVVARADVAKIQALPSFQAKVKPVLDELASEATALDDPDMADLRSFLVEARLDPVRDIEEVALCVSDPVGGAKFAVIVGGVFSSEGVVDAAAKRGESSERVTIAGRSVVKSRSKKAGVTVFLGQAEDGAIVFSNDEGLLAGALEKSDAHQAIYKLPLDAEASVVVTSGLMTKQAERIKANPFAKGFASVTGASGSLGLASPGGKARLYTASPAAAADVERELSGLLALARLKGSILGGGGGGKPTLMDALTNLKTSVDGSDVVLELPVKAEDVAAAMDAAAEALRKAKKR
jgi:hypothetical protein